ncbi:ribosomal L7Ae/L30e/S12e/Gadd45 family protein [Paenibacillus bouchesdurhonensis]|uniref:ribosomal L7Ae/L30e/S12e/Gadd45 family protein n=1 Tax=Paenibacillus bouchesdurhonensis TaxID=1870990 RepID=UPI000DA6371D|nr:ribosomal L7Ae/L30e/S12e/Gadd45 family protein [Paenibacillus bouchesdurhonensis]
MSNDRGLQDAHVKIGTKQTMRIVELGRAEEVYVAEDADPRLTSKIIALCNQYGVKLTYVDTMDNLGKACGIEVGAAMAAIERDS